MNSFTDLFVGTSGLIRLPEGEELVIPIPTDKPVYV
jgi:hypothetical protein